MNDYQMPLFDRYDMSVEFDRRLRPFKQRLREEWDRYSFKSEDELIEEIEGEIICPLEVFAEGAQMTHIGGSLYEFAVPYRGDDELWHLYPVDVVTGIYGEIFRGKLIIHFRSSSSEGALEALHDYLVKISLILELQRKRIELFESGFPSVVVAEARASCRIRPKPMAGV